MSPAATTTFTFATAPVDLAALIIAAEVYGMTPAALMREFFDEGIRRRLKPAEIDRRLDADRDRRLAAAAKIREKLADDSEAS